MMKVRYILPTLLVAALAIPAAAGDKQSYDKQSSDKQSYEQQKQQQQAQKSQQKNVAGKNQMGTVRGKITDVRTVNLKGEQGKHVLAKLQLKNGKTIVVDLGERDNLRGTKFRRNQEVSFTGRAGRINDRPVFVADRMRDDRSNATLTIIRVIPMDALTQNAFTGQQQQRQYQQNQARYQQDQGRFQQGQARQQQRGQGQLIVAGNVTNTQQASSDNGTTHLLATVRTQNGQTVKVDLGPRSGVKQMNLQQGDAIAVIGTRGQFNGQQVLQAKQVADIINIRRDGQQQQGQSASVSGD